MKALATNFTSQGLKYRIYDREKDVVLAQSLREDGTARDGFIVFHVRKYDDRTISIKDKETGEMKANFCPARESVPPGEAWGDEGWTYSGCGGKRTNLEIAFDKFVERVKVQPHSTVIDSAPSGKPRGRERNSFELDLTLFKGEFEFNLVRLTYQDQDEPMLRNRLRTALDAGQVKVVREISGGRGKPRKVYVVC